MEPLVSVTTRPPRKNEIHGFDYTFVTNQSFDQMEEDNQLLETAEVYGQRYGTPKSGVATRLARGIDLLCDVDWQGARQLSKRFPQDCTTVFIAPPSLEVLRDRLQSRASDTPATVQQRMIKARAELSHHVEYDWLLMNRDFETALGQLRHILYAERLRSRRQNQTRRQIADMLSSQP